MQRYGHRREIRDVEVIRLHEVLLAPGTGVEGVVHHRLVQQVFRLEQGLVTCPVPVLEIPLRLVIVDERDVIEALPVRQLVQRDRMVRPIQLRLDPLVRRHLVLAPDLTVVRGEQQPFVLRLDGDVKARTHRTGDFQKDVLLHDDGPVAVGDVVNLAHDVSHLLLELLVLLVVAVAAVEDLLRADQLVHFQRAQVPRRVVHQVDGRHRALGVGKVVVDVNLDGRDLRRGLEQVAVGFAPEPAVLGVLERCLAPPVTALRVLPRRRHHVRDPLPNLRRALHRRLLRDQIRFEGARQLVRL
mmetsp:Transcript_11256/g.47229  ORF Transcript_11256/g.47229 Transcript_11256/m.47229 type:complete len:299 (-) Transcript_11256:526-1422(-)